MQNASILGIQVNIWSILGAAMAVIGLMSIVTRKVYGMNRTASEYTEESLKKYSLPYGFCYLLSGAAFTAMEAPALGKVLFTVGSFNVTVSLAVLVGALVLAMVIMVLGQRLLVKKTGAKTGENE